MAGQAQPFCQPYHPRAPMIFYIFKLQICRKNQILIHCWDLCVLPHIIFQLSSCSCLILSSMSLGPWQLGLEAHSCLPSHQEAGDGRQSGSAMSGIGINFCKDRHKDGQRAQTAKKGGALVSLGGFRRGPGGMEEGRYTLATSRQTPQRRSVTGITWPGFSTPTISQAAWRCLWAGLALSLGRQQQQAQRRGSSSLTSSSAPPHLTRQPIVTTHDTPQGQDGPSQQPEHGRLVHGHLGVHRRPDRWVHWGPESPWWREVAPLTYCCRATQLWRLPPRLVWRHCSISRSVKPSTPLLIAQRPAG